ncbi:hypothetical protein PAPYR_6821 [Paratrimastix pyriformis]|uniref:Uncharacterized protein n=1 Tax=Paratrimastix pyriformis TaxID=342808 RepID=A0ABQ8UEJ4_9EUKA|nr:hypothetical protein PAPYR_6821 [Paratrimastix pyriformis]
MIMIISMSSLLHPTNLSTLSFSLFISLRSPALNRFSVLFQFLGFRRLVFPPKGNIYSPSYGFIFDGL